MMKRGIRTGVFIVCFTVGLCEAVISASMAAIDTPGAFSGSWSASGTVEQLAMGTDRYAMLLKLSGHVNLKTALGGSSDYWSECMGLGDSSIGSDFYCVWRTPAGAEIFLKLKSKRLSQGSQVTGNIVGGTGKMTGITGSLSFHWNTLFEQSENNTTAIGGYADDLTGTYSIP